MTGFAWEWRLARARGAGGVRDTQCKRVAMQTGAAGKIR